MHFLFFFKMELNENSLTKVNYLLRRTKLITRPGALLGYIHLNVFPAFCMLVKEGPFQKKPPMCRIKVGLKNSTFTYIMAQTSGSISQKILLGWLR